MNLRKTALLAMLAAAVLPAHASTYAIRVAAPGVKPAPAALPPPAPAPAPLPPPQVSLSLSDWDFGLNTINQPVSKNLILSNTGTSTATLGFSALAAPFSVTNGNCAAELLPQASCAFTVTYQDSRPDTLTNSTLTVALGGGAAPLQASLHGTTKPLPPQVGLSVTDWNFGTVTVNQSVSKVFTLSNTGSSKATLGFSGLAAPFSLSQGNCTGDLLPQANCTFTVTYVDSHGATTSNGTLNVSLGGGASPLQATVHGTTQALPGGFMPGAAKVTYSNNNTTVSNVGGSTAVDVLFTSSKSTGKWYYEMQSAPASGTAGAGAFTFGTPGGGYYYMDLRYGSKNAGGTGVWLASGAGGSITTGTTTRYGFALDADAKTMTVLNVTNCSVVNVVAWSAAGAVQPLNSFRAADWAVSNTAYFAPSGKTCIPANYNWWTFN